MFCGKRILTFYLFFISLFFLINSQFQPPVIIYPVNSNITEYCSNNVYHFEFQVSFSQKFDKLIPFEMVIPLPNKLSFKCVIDGRKSKISCFHSFSNYVWSLPDNSRVELPYSFPNIEGIRWDYDSFLRRIYRFLWRTEGNCGLEFDDLEEDTQPNINTLIQEDQSPKPKIKNDIIGNVEEIYDGECHSSQYNYTFNLKMKLNEGEIVEEFKKAREAKKNMKIEFLHNIYVPILLGEKKQKGTTTFKKDNEYKYALCQYEPGITQENFDKIDGLVFECYIPINRYVRFQGPLQIKPFTDFVYATKTDKDGKISTNRIGIEFDILSSTNPEEEEEENEEEEKETNNDKNEKTTVVTSNIEPLIKETTTTPVVGQTVAPTETPKVEPALVPTNAPQVTPTVTPTNAPQVTPTVTPTKTPQATPTVTPTKTPLAAPNVTPTEVPNLAPKAKKKLIASPVLIINKKNNLRDLGEEPKNKEPNFLLLDSNLNTFICPNKPILTIKNYDEGISFGGLNLSGSKYLFLIYGYLSNGYDFTNDTLTLLEMTKEETKFYLKVTDNLEDPDHKKKTVKCTIPSGSSINNNDLVEIRCIGSRSQPGNNNTDILLNWNLEENNVFDNIIIKWPYDLTKKKHIFYYDVKGLSVKKEDYGCFENKFYFYLYVYDLKAEPKISFNLPLEFPKNSEAVCKLYNSVTFKCVIDLRLKRLSKGGRVILPHNMTKYLANRQQNIVLYKVDSNNTLSSPLDFMLPVEEDCGDFILVGALKDVGYTYVQVIIIIISCFVGFLLCIFGIAFCVIYEITHRNRKGHYFKHTEEKEIPNTSVTQTKPPI